MIIGGDFNFEAGSPAYRELERLGFQDTYHFGARDGMLNTYDPQQNPLATHSDHYGILNTYAYRMMPC